MNEESLPAWIRREFDPTEMLWLMSATTALARALAFIRPHEALDGATPADRAGIKVEGENRWETIIQNASRKGIANE